MLIRLLFTIPVSNAAVERMFSNLGRVKTAKRSSISQGTLENILRIQAEGPPLESYDPSTAVRDWDIEQNEDDPTKSPGRRTRFEGQQKLLHLMTCNKTFLKGMPLWREVNCCHLKILMIIQIAAFSKVMRKTIEDNKAKPAYKPANIL